MSELAEAKGGVAIQDCQDLQVRDKGFHHGDLQVPGRVSTLKIWVSWVGLGSGHANYLKLLMKRRKAATI